MFDYNIVSKKVRKKSEKMLEKTSERNARKKYFNKML